MIHKFWCNRLPNNSIALLSAGVILFLAGCYDIDDDRMYPYRFEKVWEFGALWAVDDLDFDGGDEIVYRVSTRTPRTNEAWQIAKADGRVIDEITIPGRVLGPPSFADIDEDGLTREVLFAVNRNDSLFLYVYSHDAQPLGTPILITSGEKRTEQNGTVHDWEAEARFYLFDTNRDNVTELVSIVNSTFAGLPRGIFVHDKSTGDFLGSEITGAAFIDPIFIEDIDSDGLLEIAFASEVPNHGADFNGLNDSDGHIVVFELSADPKLEWRESVVISRTQFQAYSGSFTSVERLEMLMINIDRRTTSLPESDVRLYDLALPLNNQQPLEISVPGKVLYTTAGDLDGDSLEEFYVLTTDNDLLCYRVLSLATTHNLNRKVRSIELFPDLDGNGQPELLMHLLGGASQVIDEDYDVVAISDITLSTQRMRLITGEERIMAGDGAALNIIKNPTFLLYRYGDDGAIVVSVLLALLLTLFAFRQGKSRAEREIHASEKSEAQTAVRSLFTGTCESNKSALLVLEKNFSDSDFDIEKWAREIGYGGSRQLQRIVKESTGMTPEKLLWLRRINEGDRLLREQGSGLTIAEIGFRVGFKEQSHFTRKFREIKGHSPSEVRAS